MQSPIIKIDALKPIGTLVDLTGQFNARVGDAYTPITIQWTEGGKAKNLDGLHPVFEAVVGQGHVENNEVLMNDDAVPVRWVGDQSSIRGYGQTILKLPPQVFSKSGLCYGYLALENDQGVRETSVDIWFKVLGGVYNMGLACNYFITDFQKALAKAKGDVFKALDEINKNYELKIQSAENAIATAEENLRNSKKSMQTVVDEFTSNTNDLTNRLETQATTGQAALNALEAKIKQDNLVTQTEADAFKQAIQAQLDKIGNFDSYTEPGNNLIEKIINEADDRGINVRHFGAIGDGQTDDTDAFQKALDYAAAHNHSAVYVPAGKYVITRELTLNFICLFGEGLTSSVLLPKGQIPRLITLQWKAIVHNLRIDNSKVTGSIKNICLAPESGEVGTNNIIRDVYFEDNGTHEVTAIDASPKTNGANQTIFSFPNVVDSITMSNIYNGIHLYSSRDGFVNGNVFQNITIQGFRNTGIWLDGGEGRSSISHNLFSNIQVQYQKDTPDTARAFKINYGVNNKFTMIHTWQDQGTGKAIPSMELNPVAGATAWEIRNNVFDGIFESEIDGNAETINYNDLDGIQLSYWLNTSFKNSYGSLVTAKVFAQNMLPQNLISDFAAGKRSPLQWDNVAYKPTQKGIDDKGYYVKFTQQRDDPDAKSLFGLALNGPLDNLRNIEKYTVAIEFDLDGEDNKNTSFQISSGYFKGGNKTVLSKGFHQMVKLRNGVYRYYETFNNSIQSSDPMFLYAYFGGCKAINIRHFALVPGWIGPHQDIKESHNTKKWSINSATKIEFTKDSNDITTKLKLNLLNNNTNDWFDKNLIQETQRSDGSYVYTYPIYI